MRQARRPRRLKDIGLSSYARMLCASSLLGRTRLFVVIRVCSLVLLLGVSGVWLRSNWYFDTLSHGSPEGSLIFNSVCGRLYIQHEMLDSPDASRPSQWSWQTEPSPQKFLGGHLWGHGYSVGPGTYEQHELLGFACSRYLWGRGLTEDVLVLPYYAMFLLTALLPVRWAVGAHGRRKRRQRAANGLCESCGYALTGNVSGVCPECGTTISSVEP